ENVTSDDFPDFWRDSGRCVALYCGGALVVGGSFVKCDLKMLFRSRPIVWRKRNPATRWRARRSKPKARPGSLLHSFFWQLEDRTLLSDMAALSGMASLTDTVTQSATFPPPDTSALAADVSTLDTDCTNRPVYVVITPGFGYRHTDAPPQWATTLY